MLPDDPRHGTYAGANAHWAAGDDGCDPCRAAATRYHNMRKLRTMRGQPPRLSAVGGQRRIQALACLGYSFAAIARELGCSREEVRKWAAGDHYSHLTQKTHARISEVYERLSMTMPQPQTGWERRGVTLARNLSKRNGWLPPLAWVDIDDPDERPDLTIRDTAVDPVVVDRILSGDWSLASSATKPERVEVVRRWRADGRALNELERLTGWEPRRYLERGESAA